MAFAERVGITDIPVLGDMFVEALSIASLAQTLLCNSYVGSLPATDKCRRVCLVLAERGNATNLAVNPLNFIDSLDVSLHTIGIGMDPWISWPFKTFIPHLPVLARKIEIDLIPVALAYSSRRKLEVNQCNNSVWDGYQNTPLPTQANFHFNVLISIKPARKNPTPGQPQLCIPMRVYVDSTKNRVEAAVVVNNIQFYSADIFQLEIPNTGAVGLYRSSTTDPVNKPAGLFLQTGNCPVSFTNGNLGAMEVKKTLAAIYNTNDTQASQNTTGYKFGVSKKSDLAKYFNMALDTFGDRLIPDINLVVLFDKSSFSAVVIRAKGLRVFFLGRPIQVYLVFQLLMEQEIARRETLASNGTMPLYGEDVLKGFSWPAGAEDRLVVHMRGELEAYTFGPLKFTGCLDFVFAYASGNVVELSLIMKGSFVIVGTAIDVAGFSLAFVLSTCHFSFEIRKFFCSYQMGIRICSTVGARVSVDGPTTWDSVNNVSSCSWASPNIGLVLFFDYFGFFSASLDVVATYTFIADKLASAYAGVVAAAELIASQILTAIDWTAGAARAMLGFFSDLGSLLANGALATIDALLDLSYLGSALKTVINIANAVLSLLPGGDCNIIPSNRAAHYPSGCMEWVKRCKDNWFDDYDSKGYWFDEQCMAEYAEVVRKLRHGCLGQMLVEAYINRTKTGSTPVTAAITNHELPIPAPELQEVLTDDPAASVQKTSIKWRQAVYTSATGTQQQQDVSVEVTFDFTTNESIAASTENLNAELKDTFAQKLTQYDNFYGENAELLQNAAFFRTILGPDGGDCQWQTVGSAWQVEFVRCFTHGGCAISPSAHGSKLSATVPSPRLVTFYAALQRPESQADFDSSLGSAEAALDVIVDGRKVGQTRSRLFSSYAYYVRSSIAFILRNPSNAAGVQALLAKFSWTSLADLALPGTAVTVNTVSGNVFTVNRASLDTYYQTTGALTLNVAVQRDGVNPWTATVLIQPNGVGNLLPLDAVTHNFLNPGFELGCPTSGFTTVLPSTFAWAGSGLVLIRQGDSGWGGSSSGAGNCYLGMQRINAAVQQTLDGFVVGERYTLSFLAMQRRSQGNWMELSVRINGVLSFVYQFPDANTAFIRFAVNFTATAASVTFNFINTSPLRYDADDDTVFLDDVKVINLGPERKWQVGDVLSVLDWTTCASESGTCVCSGLVRYGDPLTGRWAVEHSVASSISCSSAVWGTDPAPGVVKKCQCLPTPTVPEWTTCASESGTCVCNGLVRFGHPLTGRWAVERSVASSISCSNAVWGTDPAPGVVKTCQCLPTLTASSVVESTGWQPYSCLDPGNRGGYPAVWEDSTEFLAQRRDLSAGECVQECQAHDECSGVEYSLLVGECKFYLGQPPVPSSANSGTYSCWAKVRKQGYVGCFTDARFSATPDTVLLSPNEELSEGSWPSPSRCARRCQALGYAYYSVQQSWSISQPECRCTDAYGRQGTATGCSACAGESLEMCGLVQANAVYNTCARQPGSTRCAVGARESYHASAAWTGAVNFIGLFQDTPEACRSLCSARAATPCAGWTWDTSTATCTLFSALTSIQPANAASGRVDAVVGKQLLLRSCSSVTRCGPCEGGCLSDADCAAGLVCYRRSSTGLLPPGCVQDPLRVPGLRFCGAPVTVLSVSTRPLGLCQSGCVSDSDCDSGLFCRVRSALQPVTLPNPCVETVLSNSNVCMPPIAMLAVCGGGQCGLCQGHCLSNADCAQGLVCHFTTPSTTLVPEPCLPPLSISATGINFCAPPRPVSALCDPDGCGPCQPCTAHTDCKEGHSCVARSYGDPLPAPCESRQVVAVDNSGFELGCPVLWSYPTFVTGWAKAGNVALIPQGSSGWNNWYSGAGSCYIGLQYANAAVSQVLAGLQLGVEYEVTFLSGARNTNAVHALTVKVGNVVVMPSTTIPTGFNRYVFRFVPVDLTHAHIMFINTSPNTADTTVFVDEVVIKSAGVSVGLQTTTDYCVPHAAAPYVAAYASCSSFPGGICNLCQGDCQQSLYGNAKCAPGLQCLSRIANDPLPSDCPFGLDTSSGADICVPAELSSVVLASDTIQVAPAKPNLVRANSDFEDACPQTSHSYVSSLSGWNMTGRVILINQGDPAWGGQASGVGKCYLGLQLSGSKVSQTLSGFALGVVYEVSFRALARNCCSSTPFYLTVKLGSVVLLSSQLVTGSFQRFALRYIPTTTASQVLEFNNSGPTGTDTIFIDAVQVREVPDAVALFNADFEDNCPATGHVDIASLSGWTKFGAVVLIRQGASAWNSPYSMSGDCLIGLHYWSEGVTSVTQSLTGLERGALYEISFLASARISTPVHKLTVTLGGVVMMNSITLSFGFRRYAFRYLASNATAPLYFGITSPTINTAIFLDNVQVTKLYTAFVSNAGFEGDCAATWAYATTVAGWTKVGYAPIIPQGTSDWGAHYSDAGNCFLGLQNSGSSITQRLTSHFDLIGVEYELTFLASARECCSTALTVTLGDTTLLPSTTVSVAFQRFRLRFTPKDTLVKALSFINSSPAGDTTIFLDDVQFNLVSLTVDNNNFESGCPTTFSYVTALAGWELGQGAGQTAVLIRQSTNTYNFSNSGEGWCFLGLQYAGSHVHQAVSGFVLGVEYEVSFLASPRSWLPSFPVRVTVAIDGAVQLFSTVLAPGWKRYTFRYEPATSGAKRLQIINSSPSGDSTLFVDDVQVRAVGVGSPYFAFDATKLDNYFGTGNWSSSYPYFRVLVNRVLRGGVQATVMLKRDATYGGLGRIHPLTLQAKSAWHKGDQLSFLSALVVSSFSEKAVPSSPYGYYFETNPVVIRKHLGASFVSGVHNMYKNNGPVESILLQSWGQGRQDPWNATKYWSTVGYFKMYDVVYFYDSLNVQLGIGNLGTGLAKRAGLEDVVDQLLSDVLERCMEAGLEHHLLAGPIKFCGVTESDEGVQLCLDSEGTPRQLVEDLLALMDVGAVELNGFGKKYRSLVQDPSKPMHMDRKNTRYTVRTPDFVQCGKVPGGGECTSDQQCSNCVCQRDQRSKKKGVCVQ